MATSKQFGFPLTIVRRDGGLPIPLTIVQVFILFSVSSKSYFHQRDALRLLFLVYLASYSVFHFDSHIFPFDSQQILN